ncbi:glucuronate isomerase [Propionibacteriaceae bacterium Y2011]
MATQFTPHPDRLLPADPTTREVARRLYDEVASLPIISPHGHVNPLLLLDNEPFGDPAELLITPDHYVTRMLFSGAGIDGDAVGRTKNGTPSDAEPREIWRRLAENWFRYHGTPVRYWMEHELAELFDVTETLGADNADAIYDQVSARLADDAFRPRALFDRFKIEVMATTDDPADDLAAHKALADDGSFSGRVLPTWRADRFTDPSGARWLPALDDLENAVDGADCRTYEGLLAAMRASRQHFIEHGATATDSGLPDAGSTPLEPAEAERIHAAGLNGTVTEAEAIAYRHNMLYRFAEMSVEDGLVMQLHPGVIRNHHRASFKAYGADVGCDFPDVASFTKPLEPLLNAFGTHPNLHLVLFTVDETVFSREVGPLAGFYPAVYAGVPWWFIDTPQAILRFRDAVTDSAGYYKGSGFIDDTRAFLSIPARHDMARRCDAHHLAQRVATHQITEDDATQVIKDLTTTIPTATFKL